MSSSAETGLQLLGRLTTRPNLHELDNVLFPDSIKPRELIEITGDTNCGKTLLLTNLMIKCILPKNSLNNVLIGGLDSSVIFINTDQHFQIFKMTEVMEQYLSNCKITVNKINNQEIKCLDSNDKESIIKLSLKNLTILNVYSSFQLHITIYSLKQLIADNPKINLVLFDNVSSYYWQDVQTSFCGNIRKMDMYANKLLKTLQKCIIDFNVSLIYTRPSYFKSATRQFDDINPGIGLGNVNRRINLQTFQVLGNNKMCYQCVVSTSFTKFIKYYTIGCTGFEWITQSKEAKTKEQD